MSLEVDQCHQSSVLWMLFSNFVGAPFAGKFHVRDTPSVSLWTRPPYVLSLFLSFLSLHPFALLYCFHGRMVHLSETDQIEYGRGLLQVVNDASLIL